MADPFEILHATLSATTPEDPGAELQPDNWNEAHSAEIPTGRILGRVTAGSGPAEILEPSEVKTLLDLNNVFDKSSDDSDDITEGVSKLLMTTAERAKLGYVTITQAVDLDAIETRVNALDAAVVLKGTWAANAGTFPGSGSAQAGESWIVTTAGVVNSIDFEVGDRLIAVTDNASTTTYAGNWFKADYTDKVSSVAGLIGVISAGDLRTALNVADGATANTGDVTAASPFGTDNRLIRSDGDGKGVQHTGISVSDANVMSGATAIYAALIQGGQLSMPDTGQDHAAIFVMGTNLSAARTYTLAMPDGSYTYTYPAASVTLCALDLEDQTATGGVRVTPKSLGNLSGNTINIDPGDRSIQSISGNGAGTIAPSANTGHGVFEVINTTGAAVPTTSSWTYVDGVFDNTTTSKFLCSYVITSNISVLSILKVA